MKLGLRYPTVRMASHSIANVLHCAINPIFNDGTISNPQIVLESLLSTIKAVENGNGRDPPARREETYSSIGDLLGGRYLDSITIVLAAITDGRVSKCVFRANGCCTLLPDVATCHSSPGHYMGTPGPLWFGKQDGVLVSRAFDAWSDTQLIAAPVECAWLRIDPYVLSLCHEDVIEVRDNRGVACIATLSHPGVAGFSPTRAAGTWVSYSSETVKIWKQGNLPPSRLWLWSSYQTPPGLIRILSVRVMGDVLVLERGWFGEVHEDKLNRKFDTFTFLNLDGSNADDRMGFAREKLLSHKHWGTMSQARGSRWCTFSNGTHVIGVDSSFTIFNSSGSERGSFHMATIYVDIYLDRFILAVTATDVVLVSDTGKELAQWARQEHGALLHCVVHITGMIILLYASGQLEVINFGCATTGILK